MEQAGVEQPAERTVIYRLAEFLAGGRPAHPDLERAGNILAVIQEPDSTMTQSDEDAAVWRRMVDGALMSRWNLPDMLTADENEDAPLGPDEEGDMHLRRFADEAGDPSWVQPNGAESRSGHDEPRRRGPQET